MKLGWYLMENGLNSGIKDWFKDSISKSTYHHSEEYYIYCNGKFYENQFYAIRDFDNQSISRIHGTGYIYPIETDYTAIDSNSKKSYSMSFDSDSFWLLGDSIKKEFRFDNEYHLTDHYLKAHENWEYQYTDTNQFGYLYGRRYSYFQQKDKPSVLDIYNTETHGLPPTQKNSSFYYAGATIIPTQLLNNFISEDLDSLSPHYSIHNPIDYSTPSRIIFTLAGVNVRYFGKTISFPRDKEFDDNKQEIIAEYKVVMHYTNIGSLAGTDEVEKKSKFTLYPNPAQNEIHIRGNNRDESEIEIIDFLGNVVYLNSTQISTTIIDISHLSSGIYILKSNSKNGTTSQKFVKQ